MRTIKTFLAGLFFSALGFSQCALVYNPFTNQWNCGGVGGSVGGASALTTPGSVPFVTAAGVLGQDAGLAWDSTNKQLSLFRNSADASRIRISNTNGAAQILVTATGATQIRNEASGQPIIFEQSSERARFAATTGNLLLGTTTDGNFKLDVADSGSSGGLRVWDQRATIGSTSLVVRAGAGQGGNNLTTWQDSAGTAVGSISASGVQQLTSGTIVGSNFVYYSAGQIQGYSALSMVWSGTGVYTGTKDLSLSRASAGVLQVGDGAANSNGTILARIYTWANGTEGTCDATLRGQVVMVQGGAGVADRLRLCRKDATDTYVWAPVGNNVALQVVSAGPTATVANQVRRVYVDPASVIASLTLTLPAAPLDADQVQVFFGGTLANQAAVVTTLAISPNAGQAISQFNAPVTAFGGDMVTYEYRAASARWYRIQ